MSTGTMKFTGIASVEHLGATAADQNPSVFAARTRTEDRSNSAGESGRKMQRW
jgi:hypothetical protein